MNERNSDGQLSVCFHAQVLMEFLNVITWFAWYRFEAPLPLPDAIQVVQAREKVALEMTDAGLEVNIDSALNFIGRLVSQRPDAKILIIGFYLDTVPQGGLFDGALGVLAGLEIARFLYENHKKLPFNPEMVATIGRIDLEPNAYNVILGQCRFFIEMRSQNAQNLKKLNQHLESYILSHREFTKEKIYDKPPVPIDGDLVNTICRAADNWGVSRIKMASGAGHDAQSLPAKFLRV